MRFCLAIALCLSILGLPARAAPAQKYVALTFDDGPSGKYTRALLEGLYDRGAKATFFLCGYRMQDYPDITRQILAEGHEIGCHGYSHRGMEAMSRRDIAAEIMDMEALLPDGSLCRFLRPPGGHMTDGIRQVAEVRNLSILGWSVDPQDWATDDTAAIERAVLKNIRDGDIVLLHDMSDSSVKAALDIVDALHKENFELVTVTQLARLRNVRLRPGRSYSRFPPEAGPQDAE